MVVASTSTISSSTTTASYQSDRRRSRAQPRFQNVGRAPVILEFTSTTCRAGYAGDAQPRRQVILPIPTVSVSADNQHTHTHNGTAALATYPVASRLLQDVFHQLGQDPCERHVLVVTQGLYPGNLNTEKMLTKVFWDFGVPAVRFLPSLLCVSTALSATSSTGLVCIVERTETHCVVFSCDSALPFTYHVVATSPSEFHTTDTHTNGNDNSRHASVVTALLHSLDACPRDLRKGAVGNLVFGGQVCTQQPVLGQQIARQLVTALQDQAVEEKDNNNNAEEHVNENDIVEATPSTSDPASDTNAATTDTAAATGIVRLTAVPVAVSRLRALADHVRVMVPLIRPDLYTWVGVSLWAAHWHGGRHSQTAQADTVFGWTKRPE